ncbi:TetR/AcrR family transcriptional regulator [Streptomyces sp. NBC_00257]|uniref:TetR/AcrR family transcriptional regulator n=1 Tax=Streptomyces sanglieri TaxID=193460 RepID=A0ABW2X8K1_9ACTN|nr:MULTISPECIES: TetR/AcrR family transcriptional regulator [unclassified Streptomyces]WSG49770.1 TetR/AcrR family transcriptional regulator [Streptomyces sp. NBC_01732]WSW08894.1 TetR/AcrR family transcriptional regulator [Streptomyces sp. NBC_01005]WSX00423.1 TetR/AcrR family transcriptional regulator [Streptomyces sp. NBC_00987]WTB53277.1 TetR/AcrR family transcriptional regulator [Streptomyces sp. NBC_00826]WTC98399.1 TetR/AcrR family transcriptional regulator [Streptomyces sp. NBC_01650]
MAEDRRTRRTRRALGGALVELVLERGFSALTVEDITEQADVARATFYAHFKGKDDLFARVTSDLLEQLTQRLEPAVAGSAIGFTGKPLLEMLRHVSDERDVYRVVLRGEGDGKPLQMFVDACAAATAREFKARAERNNVQPRIDADLLARVWVGEQVAVLRWWAEQDTPPMPAEEAVRMLLDLALHGRYWASGFTTPDQD